jgi:hypothetical protein
MDKWTDVWTDTTKLTVALSILQMRLKSRWILGTKEADGALGMYTCNDPQPITFVLVYQEHVSFRVYGGVYTEPFYKHIHGDNRDVM